MNETELRPETDPHINFILDRTASVVNGKVKVLLPGIKLLGKYKGENEH